MNIARFGFKTFRVNPASYPQNHDHPTPKTAISFALQNNINQLFYR